MSTETPRRRSSSDLSNHVVNTRYKMVNSPVYYNMIATVFIADKIITNDMQKSCTQVCVQCRFCEERSLFTLLVEEQFLTLVEKLYTLVELLTMLQPGGCHADCRQALAKENYLQKVLSRKQRTEFGLPNAVQVNQQMRVLFIPGMKSDVRKETVSGLLETKVYWLDKPIPLNTNMQLVNHNFYHILARKGRSF